MIKIIIKYIILLLFISPIIVLFYNSLLNIETQWLFLLKNGLINTIEVGLGSLIISFLIGGPSSILLGLYKIRFSKIFIWISILSLTLPGYTLALLYSDIFPFFFSKLGLMTILGISASPYVFLSLYTSIINTSNKFIITGKALGLSNIQIIRRILLPILKPSIVLSSLIVIAEVTSDFGASFFLGVNTLMVNIYNLYFTIYNSVIGSQYALVLILVIFGISLIIMPFKNKKDNYINNRNELSLIGENKEIIKDKKILFLIYSYLISISLLTLIIPILILIYWLYLSLHIKILDFQYFLPLLNSLLLIVISIISINVIGYIILKLFRKNYKIMSFFTLLYGLPGLIIGLGLLQLTPYISTYIGSLIILILGFSIKIGPLVINSLYLQYIKISPKLRKTWYSLGRNKIDYIRNIEIPLLKKGFITTSVLIFIEVIRELPLTLILKPFNFETLSTKIFFFQSAEQVEYSSFLILFILILTILPIIYLYKKKLKY